VRGFSFVFLRFCIGRLRMEGVEEEAEEGGVDSE
jgi:hypothetical protein